MATNRENSFRRYGHIWGYLSSWSWLLIFALLPITSLPILANISGSMVAPPSILFALFLFAVWLIPNLIKNGEFPLQLKPVLGFLAIAVAATILGVISETPPFKDVSIYRSAIKGIITLLIGIGFYIIIATYLKSGKVLKLTLQVINWSGLIVILWTFVRAGFWYTTHSYPLFIEKIQDFISIGAIKTNRAFGFTMEPSWYAHQLNMYFLPIWLAASIRKYSSHNFRILFFTFENILLAAGVVSLGLTLSRVGVATFFLMVAFVIFSLNKRISAFFKNKLLERKKGKRRPLLSVRLINILVIISFIAVYFGLILGTAITLTKIDKRMAGLFKFDPSQESPILYYANKLKLGERLAYWVAGWNSFNHAPMLGVGIGLAGYYMPTNLPSSSWIMVEVRRILYRLDYLLNLKSIWIRILVETGIIGFSFFVAWLFVIYKSSTFLIKQDDRLFRTIGSTGLFMLIAFLLEGFSVDSFALPYLWATAGLVTATSLMAFRKYSSKNT